MPRIPPIRDNTAPGDDTLSRTSLRMHTSNPLSSAGRHIGSAHRKSTLPFVTTLTGAELSPWVVLPLAELSSIDTCEGSAIVYSSTRPPSPRNEYDTCFSVDSSRATSMSDWWWLMPITKRAFWARAKTTPPRPQPTSRMLEVDKLMPVARAVSMTRSSTREVREPKADAGPKADDTWPKCWGWVKKGGCRQHLG